MGILRTLLWSATCVALGIALATVEVGGKTPWQRARTMAGPLPKLDAVVVRPTETHLDSEREAINQLVARRSTAARSP